MSVVNYPHHHAGEHAAAPTNPTTAELAHARAAADAAQLVDGQLFAAADWRLAGALVQLREEANAANPGRDRRSDGTIGDAAHAARYSKHNPNAARVVTACDLDVDGLDLASAFERLRVLAHAGRVPWLRQGGCLILNGRITAPDFSGWRVYTGPNKHITHGHADTTTSPALYDDRTPTGVFQAAPAPSPAPGGTPSGFRAEYGQRGEHVARLQTFLRSTFPAYARALPSTGFYGDQTAGVVREFAHRVGITEADGRNVGPKIAAALAGHGFRG